MRTGPALAMLLAPCAGCTVQQIAGLLSCVPVEEAVLVVTGRLQSSDGVAVASAPVQVEFTDPNCGPGTSAPVMTDDEGFFVAYATYRTGKDCVPGLFSTAFWLSGSPMPPPECNALAVIVGTDESQTTLQVPVGENAVTLSEWGAQVDLGTLVVEDEGGASG